MVKSALTLSKERRENYRKYLNIDDFSSMKDNPKPGSKLSNKISSNQQKHLTVINEIPTWINIVNDESLFRAKDILQLFGYKSIFGIYSATSNLVFPKPDIVKTAKTGTTTTMYWKKKTILDEIKRRKERNAELDKLKSK